MSRRPQEGQPALRPAALAQNRQDRPSTKVDHKDYQGDRSPFGIHVVEAVASPRVKLLQDIYHMQIMEGDLIQTIRSAREHLAHFHTGGVPSRHELDPSDHSIFQT
jgi:hydroxypyruvate isomerase